MWMYVNVCENMCGYLVGLKLKQWDFLQKLNFENKEEPRAEKKQNFGSRGLF